MNSWQEKYMERIQANGVYIDEQYNQIIITGNPTDYNHNCDIMGCSSVEHVIYRGEIILSDKKI
jgi:hypothetical protein